MIVSNIICCSVVVEHRIGVRTRTQEHIYIYDRVFAKADPFASRSGETSQAAAAPMDVVQTAEATAAV